MNSLHFSRGPNVLEVPILATLIVALLMGSLFFGAPTLGSILAITPGQVIIPQALPDYPEPDHVKNSPRGDVASAVKTAVWRTIYTVWTGGEKPPDWCGLRADGAIAIIYYGLEVAKTTGGKYLGLGLILNGGSGPSTAIWDVRQTEDGPRNGHQLETFESIPCPPPFLPAN